MDDDEKLDNEPGENTEKTETNELPSDNETGTPTDEVAALKATVEALQETVNAQQTQIYALQDANQQLMSEVENKGEPDAGPDDTPEDEEFSLTLDDLFE